MHLAQPTALSEWHRFEVICFDTEIGGDVPGHLLQSQALLVREAAAPPWPSPAGVQTLNIGSSCCRDVSGGKAMVRSLSVQRTILCQLAQ